jgi:acyl-CoA dehydrogenase
MVDYSFTREQDEFRADIKEFCEKEIAPLSKELEGTRVMSRDVIEALARKNLLGMMIDPAFGGLGLDAQTAGIAAEELARADPNCSIPVYFLVVNAWAYLLDKYGTEEAKREILPDVLKGNTFLGIATTESVGGSDLGAMETTITKTDRDSTEGGVGDGYVVNGGKMFISGVREAIRDGGGHITLAKMDPSKGTRGMNLFYLPISNGEKKESGIEPTYITEMGRDGISWGGFTIDNVEIPKRYLLGEEEKGFYIVHEGYELARGLIGMVCVGAAEKAMENGIRYIKQRRAFGKPIGKYEGIQFKLAEDHVKIESLRHITQKALWTYDQEREGNAERFEVSLAAAMSKSVATQWSFDVINNVMQWQGAFGYSALCPEQKALRGVRSFSLAEGTAEVMRLIISRELLGKEFLAYR